MYNERSKKLIEHVVKDLIDRRSISEKTPVTEVLLQFVTTGIEEYCIRRGFMSISHDELKAASADLLKRCMQEYGISFHED